MTDDVPRQPTDQEPKGAATLRILARAMIRDYANFTSGPIAQWKASRDVQKAIKDAVELAGLGSNPAALEYLNQELTVKLADLTLRLIESAKILAQEVGEGASPGMSLRGVAHHLGWGRHTVQRYARAASWQNMVKGRKRQLPSKLDPFKPYLAQRWAETEGSTTILDLHREITERGFRGHYSTVRDWIRRDLPQREGFTPAPPPPSVRRVTGWLLLVSGRRGERPRLAPRTGGRVRQGRPTRPSLPVAKSCGV
ncbi:hypothetical protein ACWD4F_41485 [Streptomyces aureus]